MASLTDLTLTVDTAPGVYDPPGTLEVVTTVQGGLNLPAIDAGPKSSDLETEEVDPGKFVVASVMLPDGLVLIGDVTLSGDAIGKFTVHDIKQFGAKLSVLAENTSQETVRFTATFTYGTAQIAITPSPITPLTEG